MKNRLLLFFLLSTACLFGQSPAPYKVDTIINYQKKVYNYTFDFDGGKQGFYWGSNDQLPLVCYFVFCIKNSSSSSIVVDKISEGTPIVKMKPYNNAKLPLTILPNDSLKIFATLPTNTDHIDVPIQVEYTRNNKHETLIIPTWQNPIRKQLLRIHHQGQDITSRCKVYVENDHKWKLLPINDSIRGYTFIVLHAKQDEVLNVRIDTGEPEMINTTLLTSRGGNGYLYYELNPESGNRYPNCFGWSTSSVSTTQLCLMSRYAYYDISRYPEYMDSIQKILNKYSASIESFNKEQMIVTLKTESAAYALDQQLRQSTLDTKLYPTIGSAQLLKDEFVIYFTTATSEDQIAALFKQVGITTYFKAAPLTEYELQGYGNAKKYTFRTTSVIGDNHRKTLLTLWNSPLVKALKQETIRNPYLPDELDD